MIEALDGLAPTDVVSIVTYSTTADVRLSPTPVSEKAEITAVVESLSAAGSTAGAPGIDLASAEAEAAFIEGGINHVVLCTDGDFNVGPDTNEQLRPKTIPRARSPRCCRPTRPRRSTLTSAGRLRSPPSPRS